MDESLKVLQDSLFYQNHCDVLKKKNVVYKLISLFMVYNSLIKVYSIANGTTLVFSSNL